ncbi:sugar transferase [Frigoribacterium sp. ACAM 257]|uniref:sugar transferase n=1 Tax=Frigoribacterium sp. ACAM 257 TaxID=2508998 RepID=UPI0011BA1BF0|nr:sugar transferase [Frigoribacterium sp. ACAM 257]TWX34025.1 sugar transferase [Frigoribacterium sp. ACAM 257]
MERTSSPEARARGRRVYETTKRVVDVVCASAALVLLSPVLLVVTVAVATRLGRPVLFRQVRPGLHGEPFTLVKFRSMLDVDPATGLLTDADRLTPFGRLLRSTSLDELPSLIGVLRGQLSLVGPRPLLLHYLPLYDAEQARRHDVRPGLTGLAQVSGRNGLDWDERLRLDVVYVDRRGPLLDLRIALRTVVSVLRRTGVTDSGDVTCRPFTGSSSPSSTTADPSQQMPDERGTGAEVAA